MATYTRQSQIPELPLVSPDFSFWDKQMQKKAYTYDQNFAKVQSVYNSVFNSPMLRDGNIQQRDNFLKSISNNLQQLSSADLSLPQNLTEANNLFEPVIQNKNIVHDISYTKSLQNQMQTADSYANSFDPNMRKLYWEGGKQYLNYKAEEYKKSDDASALTMSAPKYIQRVDPVDISEKMFKEAGISVQKDVIGKDGYKYTMKNGDLVIPIAKNFVTHLLSNDPGYIQYLNANTYVQRKNWIKSNLEKFNNDENAASQAWSTKILQEQAANNQLLNEQSIKQDEENLTKLKGTLTSYDNIIKTTGIIEGSEDYNNYKALKTQIETLEKGIESSKKLTFDGYKSISDPKDINVKADAVFTNYMFAQNVKDISSYLANKNAEVTINKDDYAFDKWKNDMDMETFKAKENYKQALELEKEQWKYEHGATGYSGGTNTGSNTGNAIDKALRGEAQVPLGSANVIMSQTGITPSTTKNEPSVGIAASITSAAGLATAGDNKNIKTTAGESNVNVPGNTIKEEESILYNRNVKYKRERIINDYGAANTEFIQTAFRIANKMPQDVTGKNITFANLSSALNDPKVNAKLNAEAQQILKQPQFKNNLELVKAARQNDKSLAVWAASDKMMNADVLIAANALNTSRKKDDKNDYTSVLDKDGRIISQADYVKNRMANNETSLTDKYLKSVMQPNPDVFIQQGVDHALISSLQAQQNKNNQALKSKYNEEYNKIKELVINKYNSQPGTRDLNSVIVSSNKAMGPKGGGIQAPVIQFNFDVQKPSDDLITVATVLGTIRKSSNSFVRIGVAGEEIPKQSDEKAKLLLDELTSNITTAYGKADIDRPVGTVTFSSIVGGTDKYHYYNIKLDAQYLKKLVGTKDNPGILYGKDEQVSSLKTKGLSLYVPANEDVTLIGQRSMKPASEYEAVMNLSPDGKYMYKSPDGSYFEMYKSANGGLIITGNYKAYDDASGKIIDIQYNPNREIVNIGNVSIDDYVNNSVLPKFDQLLLHNNNASQNPSSTTKLIKDPSQIK
jgi:hypothetical protein